MEIEKSLFKNKKAIFEQLIPFGFCIDNDVYTYSKNIVDNQFEMVVSVSKNGEISAKVIDVFSNEPYVLHNVSDAIGSFVGRVRTEYNDILSKISSSCFDTEIFKSEYSKQVIEYVREKYQDELEFLWQKFSDNAIWRRKDNSKWYAALLTVKKEKLKLEGTGTIEIIDLRSKPEVIETLIDNKKYFPGYHMNKKHWLTICLDGSVAVEEIFEKIDESFNLAKK